MPFKPQTFIESAALYIDRPVGIRLARCCDSYTDCSTPHQKARCIHSMMTVLDQTVDEQARRAIMEACGRRCLGASVLKKALALKRHARDLDDLLDCLNLAHIGGRHLRREGNAIHATYERCYCGSVSRTEEPFSSTYCHCSCGWFRGLFETLLEKPVEVELLGSIIQGQKTCRFVIRF